MAAKKRQGIEKAKMFTEKKKKDSGKNDDEVKQIWGMAPAVHCGGGGGAWRVPGTAGERATGPGLCFLESRACDLRVLNPARGPDPKPHEMPSPACLLPACFISWSPLDISA